MPYTSLVHRRFAAMAATAFLMNLNVAVVDRACGSRHEAQSPAVEHASHEHHAPADAPRHEAPPKCCDAVSSCGASLSLGGTVADVSDLPVVAVAIGEMSDAPIAPVRAPEPPPPKA